MRIITLSLAILFTTLTSCGIAFSQQPLPDDLEVYIDAKIGEHASLAANVVYQSDMLVVLRGDILIPHYLNPISNTSLSAGESGADAADLEYNPVIWKVIEMLKQEFGYSIDNIVVNGIGSRDNPDRLYVIMTKQ
jgi:hypothetical protein